MSAAELEKSADNGDLNESADPQFYPESVLKRVRALKNLQLKVFDVEAKFYEELHQLECKYSSLYEGLFERRDKIINGEYEPTEEESKLDPAHDPFYNENKENNTGDKNADSNSENVKGIPEFWLKAFENTDLISDMIQEHDEPVLKHLKDIKIKMKDTQPYGYTIEFYFNENDFFTNKILTKTYELTCDNTEDDPFTYDGPVMYRSIGCKIEWSKGKDVTVKLVKKKQKHKASGTIRVITKEEKQDSFFNFFDPPTYDGYRPSMRKQFKKETTDEQDDDENDEDLCEADFEIGHFFKEFLVPKAVLYFTGELIDEDSFKQFDEEEEQDEDDDDLDNPNNDNDTEEIEDEDEEDDKNKKKSPKPNKTKSK